MYSTLGYCDPSARYRLRNLVVQGFTLTFVAFNSNAEAYVGLNKGTKYLTNNNYRRFLIPIEEEKSEVSNKKNYDEILNRNKIYDEIVNKIRLENLEQSLHKQMYKANWIINKIVSIPKICFGLSTRSDKSKQYFGTLNGEKGDEAKSKKTDIVSKVASLEHLEQSLGDEMFKANWIIKTIMNIAKHCFGLDTNTIDIENDDTLLNKIYDKIENKTARLEILQEALDGKMNNLNGLINKTVNIAMYCFELGKPHPKQSKRFVIPLEKENILINKIYDEIVNKTARLEILHEALGNKIDRINSLLNRTVNIAKYCFRLEEVRPDNLVRRKRDVGKVPDKESKNDTQSKAEKGSRRSLLQANSETSIVQQKILNYIDDTFGEIEVKMQDLNATREQYANNDHYKIGYIMSNIDTLKVNIGNIQKEVERNKDLWSDKQILDVYDTVIKSNKALANLRNVLDLLTDSIQQMPPRMPRRPVS